MENRNRESLRELFGRFLGVDEAEAAAEEIQRAERLLELYPAPMPAPEVLAGIKRQIAGRRIQHHRFTHTAYRLVGAAAAIIVVAMIGLLGRDPASLPQANYASLIPTAIWESDDINSDDVELAYFTAEIEQIEAQMRALEAGESDDAGADTLDEVEAELLRIDADFWKE